MAIFALVIAYSVAIITLIIVTVITFKVAFESLS